VHEGVAHVLDSGQGPKIPVTRLGKDVADGCVDAKIEQCLLFQVFGSQKLD